MVQHTNFNAHVRLLWPNVTNSLTNPWSEDIDLQTSFLGNICLAKERKVLHKRLWNDSSFPSYSQVSTEEPKIEKILSFIKKTNFQGKKSHFFWLEENIAFCLSQSLFLDISLKQQVQDITNVHEDKHSFRSKYKKGTKIQNSLVYPIWV